MKFEHINKTALIFAITLSASCGEGSISDAEGYSGDDGENNEVSDDVDTLSIIQPNILFILADDLGVEALSMYNNNSGATKAITPNIDRLASLGVTFNSVWSSPLSSPTRAAAITGRYGNKTGILTLGKQLSTDEKTLHASLSDSYATALIGKWHLTKDGTNPEIYGIDYFSGMTSSVGAVDDYFAWPHTEDNEQVTCSEYITTKLTDLTIDWISKQQTPWFCWLSHVAPHTPLHLPPDYMHSRGELPADEESINDNPLPYFLAMVESMDYEIGRLLSSLSESELANTVVIFMGDNGTNRTVTQEPFEKSKSKGTVYEGGVRVPLIVSGAGVASPNRCSDVLISAPDIFATIMELSGEQMSCYEDSYSFAGVINGDGTTSREYSFTEIICNGNPYTNAIRNTDYKLITIDGEVSEFLKIDGFTESAINLDAELSDEAQRGYDELITEINSMNISVE